MCAKATVPVGLNLSAARSKDGTVRRRREERTSQTSRPMMISLPLGWKVAPGDVGEAVETAGWDTSSGDVNPTRFRPIRVNRRWERRRRRRFLRQTGGTIHFGGETSRGDLGLHVDDVGAVDGADDELRTHRIERASKGVFVLV